MTFKLFLVSSFFLLGRPQDILTFLQPQYIVPTVGLLFGLWFACWWVGRISPVAEVGEKLRTWSLATAFSCVVWIVMFPGLGSNVLGQYAFPGLAKIMEERFVVKSQLPINEVAATDIGPRTVLVDFTADWCLTCKLQESAVLHTQPVAEAMQRLGVVPVKADWTHREKAQSVTDMLDVLGSRQIPVIAVFSASDPNHPTVLHAGYTRAEVLHALETAGPSPVQQAVGVADRRM